MKRFISGQLHLTRLAGIAAYIASGLLCLVLMIHIFDLRNADIHVPFQYWSGSVLDGCAWLSGGSTPRTFWRCPVGDLLFECALVKSIGENGWYLTNPRLGAPGVQELHDFPLADALHFGLMRALFLLTPSWGAVINLYYLAGFPLAAWCALLVLRSWGLSYLVSVPTAVLFAFTPYHLFRAQAHLQLASCYLIPATIWLALTPWNRPQTASSTSGTSLPPLRWYALRAVPLGVLIGSSGTYYAFFTCYFLAVAAVAAYLERHSRRCLALPAVALLFVVVTFAMNLLPSALYQHRNGPNELVASREPQESEIFGLKIAQLILPIQHHRLSFLAAIRASYDRASPLTNENGSTSLGFLGAAGFSFLVLTALLPSIGRGVHPLINPLATLNLAAVLLGTIGGFGTIFAWLISPQIRAYNRIAIYIAFISLTAMAFLADAFWRRCRHIRAARYAAAALVPLITAAAVFDETSPANRPWHVVSQRDFYRERQYFSDLEKVLPPGAMVLQIPHQTYPEPAWTHQMAPYDALRPYLHTTHVRFSAGAVRGRYWDAWLTDLLSQHALPDALEAAAIAGFAAVLLDRTGLERNLGEIERALSDACGPPLFLSPDGRYVAFDLRRVATRVSGLADARLLPEIRDHVLHPLMVQWRGFYAPERSGGTIWRWSKWYGEIEIVNPGSRQQTVEFAAGFIAGAPSGCALRVEGPDFVEVLDLPGGQETVFVRKVKASKGRTILRFRAQGAALASPGDPRTLVFRVVNPRFHVDGSVQHKSPNPLLAPRVVILN